MTENRSLTDFLGDEHVDESDEGDEVAPETSTDSEPDPDTEQPADGDPSTDDSGPTGTATVEPDAEVPIATEAVSAVSATYAWSPDGGSCARCDTTVEARWRDGEELVCADCKDW